MIPYSLNSRAVKKGRCPACGYKNKFVFYVNNETLEKVGDRYGKCDRIESCRYHEVPNKGSVPISDNYIPPPPKPILDLPLDLISKSATHFQDNNFVQFARTLVKDNLVQEAVLRYLIGTSKKWHGATVFPQVDDKEKYRHGKIMLYDKSTGKRLKDENGKAYISSVRNELKLYYFDLKQCLFGLHLINESDTRTIAIVEAEKTAFIMSIFFPDYICMATGSLQGFKYEMLKPIKKYNIVAYPDKGCYDQWQETATELNSFGFNITVSYALEKLDIPDGSDLADVYIYGKKEVEAEIKKLPTKVIKLLTENDKIAKRFGEINPSFDTLVNTFELIINKEEEG